MEEPDEVPVLRREAKGEPGAASGSSVEAVFLRCKMMEPRR